MKRTTEILIELWLWLVAILATGAIAAWLIGMIYVTIKFIMRIF